MENWIVMMRKTYRCNVCNKKFENPKFYEEKHGLDSPPYERVAVCPHCKSGDFRLFDTFVEKIDVVEKVLRAIAALNRYRDSLKDIFGPDCDNPDFCEGFGEITELISELFDFIPIEIEKRILNAHSEKEIERILSYLKG